MKLRIKLWILIVVGALLWLSFHGGTWWGDRFARRFYTSYPVPIRLPITKKDLPKPPPEKRPWWWHLRHKKAETDTEYLYITEPGEKLPDWYDGIWNGISFEVFDDQSAELWLRRTILDSLGNGREQFKRAHIKYVPSSRMKLSMTDTEKGYDIEFDRFRGGWLKWNKLQLGYVHSGGEGTPCIRTQFNVWKFQSSIGVVAGGLYADMFFTVW